MYLTIKQSTIRPPRACMINELIPAKMIAAFIRFQEGDYKSRESVLNLVQQKNKSATQIKSCDIENTINFLISKSQEEVDQLLIILNEFEDEICAWGLSDSETDDPLDVVFDREKCLWTCRLSWKGILYSDQGQCLVLIFSKFIKAIQIPAAATWLSFKQQKKRITKW